MVRAFLLDDLLRDHDISHCEEGAKVTLRREWPLQERATG
jgi:hypothetical protein